MALRLLRRLEREGRADGGARLRGLCAPEVEAAASPYILCLHQRIGGRFEVRADAKFARDQFEISTR
jgi:hypothetical protein